MPKPEEEKLALSEEADNSISAKIKKRLMIDESIIFDEMLERTSKYIQLDSSGRVHIKSLDSLRKSDAVGLYVLGKRLAMDARLTGDDLVEADEVAMATQMTKAVATARLHDLMKKGIISKLSRGKYKMVMARADSLLTEVETKNKSEGD